jgi:hypothetical protein
LPYYIIRSRHFRIRLQAIVNIQLEVKTGAVVNNMEMGAKGRKDAGVGGIVPMGAEG